MADSFWLVAGLTHPLFETWVRLRFQVFAAKDGNREIPIANRRPDARFSLHGLCYTRDMTIKRLDHVSVVVDDLAAAIAFFTELGMTRGGEAAVEGPWVDRVNGLKMSKPTS